VSKKENGKNKTEQKDCVSALCFASLNLLGENGKHDRLKICSYELLVQVRYEHTCLVKMVDVTISKFIPMGYRFESDSKYINV
jgi:hypothetical protein